MKKQGCYYCDRDESFRELLFEICDLKASKIFLCKDQTLPGRCTIMFKDHYEEIYEIPKAERDLYMDDVCALAQTIKELFGAVKEDGAVRWYPPGEVCAYLCGKLRDDSSSSSGKPASSRRKRAG